MLKQFYSNNKMMNRWLVSQQENGQLQCGNVEEVETKHTMHSMMITPELIGLLPSSSTSQQGKLLEIVYSSISGWMSTGREYFRNFL